MHGGGDAEGRSGHEYRFRGVAERSDGITRDHDARAREVLDIVAAADQHTLWEVTQKLTWSRGWEQITGFMRRAALGETAAHVEYLVRSGKLIMRSASEHAPYRLVATGDEPQDGSGPPRG